MVTIRRASASDCDGILRAHVASIRTLCARDYAPEQVEAWAGPKRADAYLGPMSRHYFVVAEEQGEILGFGEIRVHPAGGLAPGEAEVSGLYLHPDHVGRGIGRAVMEHLRAEAIARGATRWKVHSTLTAECFYQRTGFRTISRGTHALGELQLPCILMEAELSAPT